MRSSSLVNSGVRFSWIALTMSGAMPASSACGACDDQAYCTDPARHTVMTQSSKIRRPITVWSRSTTPNWLACSASFGLRSHIGNGPRTVFRLPAIAS